MTRQRVAADIIIQQRDRQQPSRRVMLYGAG